MTNEHEQEMRQLAQARSRKAADKAATLLTHYIKKVWIAAGLEEDWHGDNESEIAEIVDLIVEAAAEASR